ncbi:MAG: 2-oxoacid:acceptor oxidoreductase subunit alpha [Chloroflexi bacterium]|nr:2-oxoacid:acceptor oxidoreductase subunit alpha [Chloroflexota bacterium]MBU1750676.1 2-oxoacid:acceptor oxidoreductase subunit alpha [Chloroflexota bacterium]
MPKNDMTFKIGGAAGQGVESSGAGFAQALARGGLHVFGMPDYMSRIRGGHNFYQIRVSERPLYSHADEVHLLLALEPETIDQYKDEVVTGGGIIYDEALEVNAAALEGQGFKPFPVPLAAIAEEAGDKIMLNTAALGVAAGVTGYEFERMAGVIRDNFAKKGQPVIDANLTVARRAYEFAQERYAAHFGHQLAPVEAPARMVINGNHALCLGALLAGCRFLSAYPMTPASSIMEWLAGHADRYDLVVKHTEDELAAILMAIGANHAGVRGMTATSGGGFSLMVEALGMAGMTETPLVVVEVQRPGPSTGMPTRTEQGDLLFILHASQGEFPRIVLAPGSVEECFTAGWRAFNLAEMYQCPVIIISDNYLANSVRSIERAEFHFEDVAVDRGELMIEEELDLLPNGYKRYALTESGISPRALPGHPKAVWVACSDEHDEYGNFADEDPENRVQMVRKRLHKLDAAGEEMGAPQHYGPQHAETTLVGWGSSYGPVREAVDRANATGGSINFLHFTDIWPFSEDRVRPLLESAHRLVAVENNATGQFARLLRMNTGVQVDDQILRFDGRPFSPAYVLDRL